MTEPQAANPTSIDADDQSWMTPRQPLPPTGNDRLVWVFGIGVPLVLLIAAGIFLLFAFNKEKALKAVADAEKPVAVAPAVEPQNAKDIEIAQLRAEIAAMQSRITYPGAVPQPVYADQNALAQFSARLDRIEATQKQLAFAAAQANAAARLEAAARRSQPFARELRDLESTLEHPSLLDPIRPFAERGVASETLLAVQFPKFATEAAIVAKSQPERKDLLSKFSRFFSGLISIRRIGDDGSQNVEALLSRAQSKLERGDLEGAVITLSGLPAPAQTALKPWLDQARARLLIANTTRNLTEGQLAGLGVAMAVPATTTGGVR